MVSVGMMSFQRDDDKHAQCVILMMDHKHKRG